MPRVLGITCSGADAYLTVLDVDATTGEDVVVAIGPERVRPVSAGDHGDSLVRSLAGWRRVLATSRKELAVALMTSHDADDDELVVLLRNYRRRTVRDLLKVDEADGVVTYLKHRSGPRSRRDGS